LLIGPGCLLIGKRDEQIARACFLIGFSYEEVYFSHSRKTLFRFAALSALAAKPLIEQVRRIMLGYLPEYSAKEARHAGKDRY
jgi:hypothetical protein